MPQGRIILKSISESKKVAALKTESARLLYTWLIPHLDVNGCFSGDPVVVNHKIFTRLHHTHKQVESYLSNMEQVGLIIQYEANGDQFLFVPDFQDKQPSLNPDREGKPSIPLPTKEQILQSNSRVNPDLIPLSKGKQSKGKQKVNPELIREFFDYYNNTLKKKGWIKRDYQLNYIRRRIIESRLHDGCSLADLKQCVDNMITDPWEDRHRHCDIVHCIGIRNNVDNFDKWLNLDAEKKAKKTYSTGLE